MNSLKRWFCVLSVGVAGLLLTGCGETNPDVNVADLNKVLDIFDKVLEEPKAKGDPVPGAPAAEKAVLQPLDSSKEDKVKTAEFLKKFAKALNDAKLISAPIGVHFKPDGSLEGFTDPDQNMTMSPPAEQHLFRIQIDVERSRVIASDETNNHHRDHGYHYQPSGLFTGYLLGSMLGRQNNYYSSGVNPKPNFGSMPMSSPNYHGSAVSSAHARVKASGGGGGGGGGSARTRGGSGGFSFGK